MIKKDHVEVVVVVMQVLLLLDVFQLVLELTLVEVSEYQQHFVVLLDSNQLR